MYELKYDKGAVGIRVREHRTALRLTQEKVADRLDMSLRTITDIERGVVGMSIETLLELCTILKVSPDALLVGSSQEDDEEMQWLITALRSTSEETRACAIDIVRAYLRHN